MNEQEIEIAIEVLKERQRVQANHLKDVDECCGKLKGSTDQEYRIITERISRIENHMESACEDMKLDLSIKFAALNEREKAQCEQIKELTADLNEIHAAYRKVTIEFILAVILGIIALFIHV